MTVSGDSGQDVVVTQEICPQYRGALVVCEGGGSEGGRRLVGEAVSARTGRGSDRIAGAQGRAGGGGGSTEGGTAG